MWVDEASFFDCCLEGPTRGPGTVAHQIRLLGERGLEVHKG